MTAETTESASGPPVKSGAPGPRALARRRRRASVARFWREYRRHRAGVFGLAALVLFVLVALTAPLTVGSDVDSVTDAAGQPLESPSGRFPLGTDQFGRNLLGLLIWGSRVSLLVGLLAAALSVLIGALIGITAGHFRGWYATVMMRITDWFLVMPTLVLAIVLATVLSRSLGTIVLAIGVTTWPTTARLVRAQTLAVESRPYIERRRRSGRALAHHVPACAAQRHAADPGADDADHLLRDPGRGDPGLPRARGPGGRVLGRAAAGRARGGFGEFR
ncbi:ABC transporter permease OS=Streptomyces tendae OX=1932 GN=GUR47_38135 PE=3 SV=1 [Streptomyces tendae]